MTNEEADQLIAEIKAGDRDVGCILDFGNIEKTIKRFANKPPEGGYIVKLGGIGGVLRLQGCDEKCKSYLEFWDNDDELISTGTMSIDELTQLRDNCNKMLLYLEGSND